MKINIAKNEIEFNECFELGLLEAKRLGLGKVLITCDINNIGSKKVILKNGGIFERLTSDGKMNRFWINL